MCNRPDFEAEDQELDERLLSLFRLWKEGLALWLEPEEIEQTNLLEEFCRDMRNRLPELLIEEQAKLPASERT